MAVGMQMNCPLLGLRLLLPLRTPHTPLVEQDNTLLVEQDNTLTQSNNALIKGLINKLRSTSLSSLTNLYSIFCFYN